MPYDLQLPNGKFLRNIDDNVNEQEAFRNWAKNSNKGKTWATKFIDDNYTEQSRIGEAPTLAAMEATRGEEYSDMDLFRAGAGQGITDIGRNIGNMVGLVDDETLEQADLDDQALMDTSAGLAGSLVGSTAALAPLGVVGGAGRAVNVASKAANPAVKAARGLARSRTAALGAEGAVGGMIEGEQNNRGSGAALGALVGGGLGLASSTAGVAGRGRIRTSPEAEAFEKANDVELPMHIAADAETIPGAMYSWVHREVLPYLPGTGQLRKGMEDADKAFEDVALKIATPEGVDATTVRGLHDTMEKAYGEIEDYAFSGKHFEGSPSTWGVGVPRKIVQASEARLQREGAEGVDNYTGTQLIDLRKWLAEKADSTGEPGYKRMLQGLDKDMDNYLRIDGSAENIAGADALKAINGKYDEIRRVADATTDPTKSFVKGLSKATSQMNSKGEKIAREQDLTKLSDLGVKLMGKELANPSLWGRIATGSTANRILMGEALKKAGGVAASVVGMGVPTAIGAAQARKGFQRKLRGKGPTQKMFTEARDKMLGNKYGRIPGSSYSQAHTQSLLQKKRIEERKEELENATRR